MRAAGISLNFALLVLAIFAVSQIREINANPEEVCRPGNCMASERCELLPTRSLKCPNSGEVCCSLVKSEYRSLCQHWGGECMSRCTPRLMQKSTDCSGSEVCCVLV